MELQQLQYFKITAELEHISQAAEALHIAQPALSQTIKRLEKELGTTLFDRIGKNIELNEKGRILLKYSNQIFTALNGAKSEIADSCDRAAHILSISIESASSLLPELLQLFRKQYPQTIFKIYQNTGLSPLEQIDLRIYSTIKPPKDHHHCVLLRENIVIALPKEHTLANRKQLKLADLSQESFISLSKGSNLTNIIDYYCNQAGFTPNISLYCDNPNALRELLNFNFGIALLPEITWNCHANTAIAVKEIRGMHCSRYIILSWPPDAYLSALACAFRQTTIDFFHDIETKL